MVFRSIINFYFRNIMSFIFAFTFFKLASNLSALILWLIDFSFHVSLLIVSSFILFFSFLFSFERCIDFDFQSIDSILKFAPYIRNIFIITDEQAPSFLNKKSTEETYKKSPPLAAYSHYTQSPFMGKPLKEIFSIL